MHGLRQIVPLLHLGHNLFTSLLWGALCDPFKGMAAEESVWKHDLHDISRVCKKLSASERVYAHITNIERKLFLSPAC